MTEQTERPDAVGCGEPLETDQLPSSISLRDGSPAGNCPAPPEKPEGER